MASQPEYGQLIKTELAKRRPAVDPSDDEDDEAFPDPPPPLEAFNSAPPEALLPPVPSVSPPPLENPTPFQSQVDAHPLPTVASSKPILGRVMSSGSAEFSTRSSYAEFMNELKKELGRRNLRLEEDLVENQQETRLDPSGTTTANIGNTVGAMKYIDNVYLLDKSQDAPNEFMEIANIFHGGVTLEELQLAIFFAVEKKRTGRYPDYPQVHKQLPKSENMDPEGERLKHATFKTCGISSQTHAPAAHRPSLTHSPPDLPRKLGNFSALNKNTAKYLLVEKYLLQCPSPTFPLKIHNIFENTLESDDQPTNAVLLWRKATPENLKKLAKKTNRTIVLYDRAFKVIDENVGRRERQLLLLCRVDLGKSLETTEGYSHWKKREFPHDVDSIKGIGRNVPDEDDERHDGSARIPCGKTVCPKKYSKCTLKHNEYIVHDMRRVTARYVIEFERLPNEDEDESCTDSDSSE